MKKLLKRWNNQDTIQWFENRGVDIYAQEDQRMFPTSDNSESIANCLIQEAKSLGVRLLCKMRVDRLEPATDKIVLHFSDDRKVYDKVIVCTGGSPKKSGLLWLEDLGHEIVDPVPSLFTFNIPDTHLHKLMGLSVAKVVCRIPSLKLSNEGPALITHWGLSGPAILKLSAIAARDLAITNYRFDILMSWSHEVRQEVVFGQLQDIFGRQPKKKITNISFHEFPQRMWEYLLDRAQIPEHKICAELSKKDLNRLAHTLSNDAYEVHGKTTFKEEFVTCGGISLDGIDHQTMQSKAIQGLYFAGEVLDIDGITGGFNFQAAWTTAYIAAQLQ